MGKGKLKKFSEVEGFSNVIQPVIESYTEVSFHLKGNWNKQFFNNNNPVILELGCGKGEYTVGLARQYKAYNFIGVDIKGARIWKGAKMALENQITNAAFLRTRIDLIPYFFEKEEVSEIWITFPDPQPKKQNKRLTSAQFLKLYQKIMLNNGVIHLKTDNSDLHNYTLRLLEANNIVPTAVTDNLYNSNLVSDILNIKTFYESQFLAKNKPITYLQFQLPTDALINEIEKYTYEKTGYVINRNLNV